MRHRPPRNRIVHHAREKRTLAHFHNICSSNVPAHFQFSGYSPPGFCRTCHGSIARRDWLPALRHFAAPEARGSRLLAAADSTFYQSRRRRQPRAEIRTIATRSGRPFLLFVDVPTEARFNSYQCLLYSPSGKMIWQLPITAVQAANTVSIQVPAESAEAGVNTLVIQGVPSDGPPVDVVKYRFLLQVR